MRGLLQAFVGAWLPSRFKNFWLRRLGHEVPGSARVGMVLLSGQTRLSMGARASIGHFNVIKDVGRVELGEDSVIGQWNWITASTELVRKFGAPGRLTLGAHSAISSRHYLDCSGGIDIGAFTTVAGVRTTIFTHGIDWRDSAQKVTPVSIGDYVLMGSNAVIPPGGTVPDRAVVAMGTVIGKDSGEPGSLIAGPRAGVVKPSLTGAYFDRRRGYVA
ncbi:acyltransferase [Demequina gelatinilytica]|uniref:acyltransferase n=1 Tax=Demequina gelatinilytica TaxID=1638980 RepID=UPI000783F890|nr:DapH/DapD/GlmU-related protein [Demequina gelatinilytica]